MKNTVMTFGEIFRGISAGDLRLLVGFSLECLIMLSPFLIVAGAIWWKP